jgi:Tol biopolymer transport system component
VSDADRWKRVKAIFDAATARPADDRASFVRDLCGDDRALLADVESLLAADTAHPSAQAQSIDRGLQRQVFSAVADVLDTGTLALAAGERFGPYEVSGFLGAGGMGRVYRARDITLGRDVALKVLPELWLNDPDRRARFEREARLLASLNHPNIGAIYGVQESSRSITTGVPIKALVLELVEGETLSDHISVRSSTTQHGLPIEEAVTIAGQVIDALEAAHDRGIVHRDLKPGNIKITPEGRIKVLDFGLARAMSTESSRHVIANSPTVTAGGTQAGVLLGTAQYMSPEQARGKVVDKRADIWAFGCVLYEMITGAPVFAGVDTADVIANVIKAEPGWAALPDDTPRSLRLCLERCLQKDLRQRFHDIADARLALEGAFDRGVVVDDTTRGASTRVAHAGWALAILATAAAFVIAARGPRAPAPAPETWLEIVTPPSEDPLAFAISPDGRSVVYQADRDQPRLWLRSLDSSEARPLIGTEGGRFPFWSPDSRSVGFTSGDVVKRIDIEGGPVRTLANHTAIGASWNDDGQILLGSGIGPVRIVSSEGGGEQHTTTLLPGQVTHRWPQFLPDGRRFLLFALGASEQRGIYSSSLADTQVRRVSDRESGYRIMLPGHVLFARQGALWARAVSRDYTSVQGGLVPVAPKVLVHRGLFGYAAFSTSAVGSIAYRASAGETQLVWLDRMGRRVGTVGQADDSQLVMDHLSDDGRTVAVQRTIAGSTNVWLLDTDRGVPRRLTFGVNDNNIVFSPDGSRIAHQAEGAREGTVIWERRSDGTGGDRMLRAEPQQYEFDHPRDWSPDGRYILYVADTATSPDLRALPLSGDPTPIDVTQTPFGETDGRFSPDGRWVALVSNETGQAEVYVQPFPGPGPKSRISVGGGTAPRWRRDGSELFYLARENVLTAVSIVRSESRFESGPPRTLFTLATTSTYEPSPDGQRFLVTAVVSDASPITVILNWKPRE